MMGLAAEEVTSLTELLTNLGYFTASAGSRSSFYDELRVADALHGHFTEILSNPAVTGFADKLRDIDFNFFGLNLSATPKLFFSCASPIRIGMSHTLRNGHRRSAQG